MAGRDTGPGGPPAEQPGVPPSVLRSWDEAEARLFPLVMAQPELYQQALGAVRQLLGRLRETCHDLPGLLAAHERGGDLLAGAEVPGVRPALIAAWPGPVAKACPGRWWRRMASPNGRPTCPTNGSKPNLGQDAP